jgi:hypothetical protein
VTLNLKSTVVLKIVLKARHDMYTGEKQPMREKESWKRIYDAAFRIRKLSQRSKKKLCINIFIFQPTQKM